jgi:hypothetical protein
LLTKISALVPALSTKNEALQASPSTPDSQVAPSLGVLHDGWLPETTDSIPSSDLTDSPTYATSTRA